MTDPNSDAFPTSLCCGLPKAYGWPDFVSWYGFAPLKLAPTLWEDAIAVRHGASLSLTAVCGVLLTMAEDQLRQRILRITASKRK